MAFCRVTYRDIEAIEHSVEVEAESLYEAIAQAVKRFRHDDGWALSPPGPGCHFHVKALRDTPITYSISLDKSTGVRVAWYCQRSSGHLAEEADKRVARADGRTLMAEFASSRI